MLERRPPAGRPDRVQKHLGSTSNYAYHACPCAGRELGQPGAEVALRPRRGRSPAASAGFLRATTLEDTGCRSRREWNLADEYAGGAADRVGHGRRAPGRADPSRATRSAPAAMHARLIARSHHLVDRRPIAANGDLPGGRASAGDRQHVAERLGKQNGIARIPSRISWLSWRPSPQGASCRSWAVRSTEPAVKHARRRAGHGPLRRPRRPPFHVGRTAAGQPAVVDLRTARTAGEPCRGGRRIGASGPAGRSSVAPQRPETAGYPPAGRSTTKPSAFRISASRSLTGPAVARRARDLDQPPRGLDQPTRRFT